MEGGRLTQSEDAEMEGDSHRQSPSPVVFRPSESLTRRHIHPPPSHGRQSSLHRQPRHCGTHSQSFHVGRSLGEELATEVDKSKSHPAALTTKKYGVGKWELLKACLSREYLLMKCNSFVYTFKLCQLAVLAIIAMTIFLRTEMHRDSLDKQAFNSSHFPTPYFLVVKAAGWLLDLSNSVASSSPKLLPT
ncbi:hypothetical protein RJT34_18911 [Clitoria ternatea]|uniref:Uncharacterized protein n=1 Tax=Clitoria ternatea TaxID=43366 RepID=A0AAN9IQ22_CLITE